MFQDGKLVRIHLKLFTFSWRFQNPINSCCALQIAFFSNDFELITPEGRPFARSSPSGTLYKLDIIPQPDFVPTRVFTDEKEEKAKGVKFEGEESENPLEKELLVCAEKEVHASQKGFYYQKFQKKKTSEGAVTKLVAEHEQERQRLQKLEAEQMKHNVEEVKRLEELELERERLQENAILARQKAEEEKHRLENEKSRRGTNEAESEADQIKRLAEARSLHRKKMGTENKYPKIQNL